MGKRKTRNERIAEIQSKLSRRDFVRYSALSTVAASMCANARADILVHNAQAGSRCVNYLMHLDQGGTQLSSPFTISQMMFSPFNALVNRLKVNADNISGSEVRKGLADLKAHVDANFDNKLELHHLYSYDKASPPPSLGYSVSNWRTLYVLCERISMKISMPFLELPPRRVSYHRQGIEKFLTVDTWKIDIDGDGMPDDATFEDALGAVNYRNVFLKGRKELFPRLETPGDDDETRYLILREAFELNIFKQQYAGDKADLHPNDECAQYSGGQWTCLDNQPGKYCEIDNSLSPPQPTSASDICP